MKNIPFAKDQIEALVQGYPTPFYVYDEEGIRKQARKLIEAFSWNAGFKEYFAVKALPNPAIVQILKEEGCGADCSALPELVIADRAGIRGEDIMYTSNDTPAQEFVEAKKRGAIINLDDINHLGYLERHAGLPDMICFRYNPGATQSGNAIIGNPAEAKFGVTREQLFEGYAMAKEKGVTRFGLHTMPISNELNANYFVESALALFKLAREIEEKVGIQFEFINMGGGIGIPYKPEQKEFDLKLLSDGVRETYESTFGSRATPVKLFLECGRFVTGPFGYLVSRVRHVKESYKKYVGLDACMANLMRPAMYGAYHHITVLGKEGAQADTTYDVVGSLCENNDKFAINRQLPEIAPDDIIVIHDAGAHGHAMGFNYNGKLRSAEFLLCQDGSFKMIRRAETTEDYFATLNF
ncbi:MAG: diaminopimelate decarboxylase [bacterium]|nr:diaminopimelate decarboxylase [bacterium]